MTFDLHDSDLPLQVAFPILFSNLVNFLAPVQPDAFGLQATQIHPGESLAIQPPAGAKRILVTAPSGKQYALTPGENGSAFSDTGETGFYQVDFFNSNGSPTPAGPADGTAQTFAVDLFSPLESDIHPQQTIQVGRSQISAAAQAATGQRELWPWLAGLALFLLAVEWWVYQRRQRLPFGWREWLRAGLNHRGLGGLRGPRP